MFQISYSKYYQSKQFELFENTIFEKNTLYFDIKSISRELPSRYKTSDITNSLKLLYRSILSDDHLSLKHFKNMDYCQHNLMSSDNIGLDSIDIAILKDNNTLASLQ